MGKLLEAKRVSWSRHLQHWCSAPDLICLYNRDGAVEIPNLCTGQHTTLPVTPTWSDFETEACAHVGLDGSSAYKVLKSESCFGLDKVKHWVLTLGVDATWREIKAPDCHFRTSVCINGVTYFEDVIFRNRSRWKELFGGFPIVAFDVWSETFHGVARPLGETEFDLVKSSFLELDGALAIICLRHKRLITWSLDSASCWKKNVFPAPLDSASLFYCTIKTTPTGEILLVMPNERGTCSLWVLFDKFTCPVWKKFGIEGLGEFPNYNCEMIKAIKPIMVQNVAENLFHLE
ncbi:unnamed protein product [Cuscuta epithymum]|uniref:F-box associated beta-propeller type 3 domain-containing protein n=1 Tax=Cuscuta epithymum TaxID=186058 RepID=A0AAV0DJI8_9ASTE|nr:unnamed protein product [Cuscuta epithymum]